MCKPHAGFHSRHSPTYPWIPFLRRTEWDKFVEFLRRHFGDELWISKTLKIAAILQHRRNLDENAVYFRSRKSVFQQILPDCGCVFLGEYLHEDVEQSWGFVAALEVADFGSLPSGTGEVVGLELLF